MQPRAITDIARPLTMPNETRHALLDAALAPAPALKSIQTRMDIMQADGKLHGTDETTVPRQAIVGGKKITINERFVVQVIAHGGELLLTFTSCERMAVAYSQIVNGRDTHGAASHTRRILLTTNGDMHLEAGSVILLTANNKYASPARSVIAAHLHRMEVTA